MYSEDNDKSLSIVEVLKLIISGLATCAGLVVVIIGLKYSLDVFDLIFTMLHSPSYLTDPVQQLAASFGGDAFDIVLSDRTIPLAKFIALVVYCLGVLTCAFLTMAMMQTGAKMVSLTAGDKGAIKQLLQHAFGRRLQPREETEKNRERG